MATIVHANDFFNCLYIAVLFILNTLRDNKVGVHFYIISMRMAQNGPGTRITWALYERNSLGLEKDYFVSQVTRKMIL